MVASYPLHSRRPLQVCENTERTIAPMHIDDYLEWPQLIALYCLRRWLVAERGRQGGPGNCTGLDVDREAAIQ